MPYVIVTTGTLDAADAALGVRRIDGGGHLAVTFAARTLGDVVIPARDAQRIRIPSRCEIEGVPEAVLRLGEVFRDEPGRRVTVVANGDGSVARARPRVEMILHHMAVGARARIVGEIRVALCVDERVGADADDDAD